VQEPVNAANTVGGGGTYAVVESNFIE